MPNDSGKLKLKQGPGPLTYLELQDVIDRLENRIILLERGNVAMAKKLREMEMHIRQLARTSRRNNGR